MSVSPTALKNGVSTILPNHTTLLELIKKNLSINFLKIHKFNYDLNCLFCIMICCFVFVV